MAPNRGIAAASVLTLPGPLCLYSQKGLRWLEELVAVLGPAPAAGATASTLALAGEEAAGHSSAPPLLVHLTNASSDETCPHWALELTNSLLLEELAARIYRMQSLLASVALGSRRVVFTSAYSCKGSVWELALACHDRLWFDDQASLGFPDLAHHAPPVSLLLTNPLAWQDLRQLDPWQKAPLVSALQAERQGFVDFLAAGADPLPTAQRWLVSTSQRTTPTPRGGLPRAYQTPPALLAYEGIIGAEKRWLRHKKSNEPAASADFATALHKARRQLGDDGEFASLCYYGLARHYLSESYLQRLALPERAPPPALPAARLPARGLCFDISQALPPLSMVEGLLREDRPVTYRATQAKTLAAGLERTYLKLERRFQLPVLHEKWQRRLTWFVGTQASPTSLVLTCELSDSINLTWQGHTYRFINLQGNQLGAACGLWEFLPEPTTASLPPDLVGLLVPTVSAGIVSSPTNASGVPLSSWLRSHFLDELLRISSRQGAELAKVVAALESCGWGFVATASQWGRFLQTRHAVSSDRWPASLAAYAPDHEHTDLGSWKQACLHVERSKSAVEELWHATGVSFHMALYAGALAGYLSQHAWFASPEQGQLFVSKAFELPQAYGSPAQFCERWGRKRFHSYCAAHWPSLAGLSPHKGKAT